MINIIIAIYNGEDCLTETLNSLNDQTCKSFRVIVVDGGSTDNTLCIVNKYSNMIDVCISEPDRGIADAWNKGLRHVSSGWVLFLNAGDIIHRDHIYRVTRLINEKNLSGDIVLYCDVLKFTAEGEVVSHIKGTSPTNKKIMLGSIGFAHPGSITSFSCFARVGNFDENIKIAIDTDWLLRAFTSGVCFEGFKSTAYMAEDGLSNRMFRRAIAEFYVSAHRLGLVSRTKMYIFSMLLPKLRKIVHVSRKFVHPILRTLKHLLLFCVNAVSNLIVFHSLRIIIYKLIGFKLGRKCSIGYGFGFYRVGNIAIGEFSVINRNCLFDNRGKISIGDNVSISRNVSIFTGGHEVHSPFFEMTIKQVRIEDHVVIFSGAMIMPGVTIGSGAVVFSGAVVTKDVEPNSIVAGVPAQKIGVRQAKPIYRLNYCYPMAM